MEIERSELENLVVEICAGDEITARALLGEFLVHVEQLLPVHLNTKEEVPFQNLPSYCHKLAGASALMGLTTLSSFFSEKEKELLIQPHITVQDVTLIRAYSSMVIKSYLSSLSTEDTL